MAKIRHILSHVSVEEAQRQRICHHDRKQHSIAKGEACLVVREPAGGRKNYCAKCASDILEIASKDVRSFRSGL